MLSKPITNLQLRVTNLQLRVTKRFNKIAKISENSSANVNLLHAKIIWTIEE